MTFTGPDLCKLTATQAVGLLRKGEVSPAELIEASEKRIAQVEPAVNALPTTCFERARTQADDLKNGDTTAPGWLGGLPISIKDLNNVKGVRTTFGNKALADNISAASDPLIERLEERGGLIVAKSNTPEFGAGGNTFNEVFGYTRNPWDTRKNAGGSSGGAAVSLATGEVWLAHGSDLAGSLRTPAAYCGVVGMRPSPGVSGGGPAAVVFEREGISGPMARNVQDCALFLDAMTGFDPRMPLSLDPPVTPFQVTAAANAGDIRIAYAPDLNGFAEVEPEIEAIMQRALMAAEGEGVSVEDACPNIDKLEDTYVTLRGIHYGAVTARLPAHVQATFKDTLKGNVEVGKALTADTIYDAKRNRSTLYHNCRTFLEGYDVLAFAVVGLEPGLVEVEYPAAVNGVPTRDYVEWLKLSYLSTATSLPSISIPCGLTASGMPVGIQLLGQPRGDGRLLQVARKLESIWGLHLQVPIDPIVK